MICCPVYVFWDWIDRWPVPTYCTFKLMLWKSQASATADKRHCHRWMDTYRWANKQNEYYWHTLMFSQWIDAINTNIWGFEPIDVAFFACCVLNLFVSLKDRLKAVYVLFLSFTDHVQPVLPMIGVTYPWDINASAHLFLHLQISLVNMLSHLFLVSKQSSALSASVY